MRGYFYTLLSLFAVGFYSYGQDYSDYIEAGLYASTYQVEEVVISSDHKEAVLAYTIDLKAEKLAEGYKVQLQTRHQDFDTKLEDLAAACMQAIEPLHYRISREGGIAELLDHKGFVDNFKKARPKIEGYFVGDIAKRFINAFQQRISDEAFVTDRLKSLLLSQLLFPKKLWFAKTKFTTDFSPMQGAAFLPYQCTAESTAKGGVITVHIKGTEQKSDSEIELTYHIDKKSKQLQRIEANIEMGSGEKHMMKIKK